MIILIRSIQMLECIMSKDIKTALECYKMWTSVSMGNILDVLEIVIHGNLLHYCEIRRWDRHY